MKWQCYYNHDVVLIIHWKNSKFRFPSIYTIIFMVSKIHNNLRISKILTSAIVSRHFWLFIFKFLDIFYIFLKVPAAPSGDSNLSFDIRHFFFVATTEALCPSILSSTFHLFPLI